MEKKRKGRRKRKKRWFGGVCVGDAGKKMKSLTCWSSSSSVPSPALCALPLPCVDTFVPRERWGWRGLCSEEEDGDGDGR